MANGPFFLKSKYQHEDWCLCDDCGRSVSSVSDESYYNPNPRAILRKICKECYNFRIKKKQERWDKRLAALEAEEAGDDLDPAICKLCDGSGKAKGQVINEDDFPKSCIRCHGAGVVPFGTLNLHCISKNDLDNKGD